MSAPLVVPLPGNDAMAKPLLFDPDRESEQWATAVAHAAGAP